MADAQYAKGVSKVVTFGANLSASSASSTAFQLPVEHGTFLFQVGIQTTPQTIILEGSVDGTTWVSLSANGATLASINAGTPVFKPLTRANLGYYAYYHFKNLTATAGVSCAITSNVPFV